MPIPNGLATGFTPELRATDHHGIAGRESAAPMQVLSRASRAAYQEPSVAIVKASVASAIDGVAPNNPAKLFGLRIFPKVGCA